MSKKPKADLNLEHAAFRAEVNGDVAILRFTESPMLNSTNLGARDALFEYLDLVTRSDAVKVLMMVGYAGKTGREEYVEFYKSVLKSRTEQSRILKMCNIYNQLILKIVGLPKFVLCVDQGRIITQFVNIGLASDYRMISDDTVFEKAYLDVGTVPKGGGPYFLTKILGKSRAMKLLLSEQDITAKEALEMGLVDQVASADRLEETALDVAREFAAKPSHTLYGVKKMINWSVRDLKEYLDFENLEIMRIVACPEFGQRLGCI